MITRIMATIKLKFRPSSVLGGMGTLYYQLIHKRNVKWISAGFRMYADEWDEEKAELVIKSDSERKAELLQMQSSLKWELEQRKKVMRSMETANSDVSLSELCEGFGKIQTQKTVFTFMQEQVLKKEKMKRQGSAMAYGNAYRRFKEFREDVDLTFDELTADMIERYEAWLINRRLKQNTIRFYLRTLKAIFGKAINEGLLADRSLFSRVRLSYVKTAKRAITEKELKAIGRLSLPEGSALAFARDIFMFSFYMRGMPFVDIAYLRKADLKNGTLSYCRKKTGQHLTVEWERVQQQIVDRYAYMTENSQYMLPIINNEDGTEYEQYRRVQENVNNNLKKIGKMIGLKMPLTAYVARHTWACVARDMNISVAIISEGMGHRSYKTTQVYLNSIDTSRINEANRKIIQRINSR